MKCCRRRASRRRYVWSSLGGMRLSGPAGGAHVIVCLKGSGSTSSGVDGPALRGGGREQRRRESRHGSNDEAITHNRGVSAKHGRTRCRQEYNVVFKFPEIRAGQDVDIITCTLHGSSIRLCLAQLHAGDRIAWLRRRSRSRCRGLFSRHCRHDRRGSRGGSRRQRLPATTGTVGVATWGYG